MTEEELYQQYLKETGQNVDQSQDPLYQQYLKETGGSASGEDVVLNEMHPGIDFTTRAVYKNFGADPEASFNYLQKKHPELQFKKDKSGDVLAKAPGELAWRKLDPSTFEWQDVTDVGTDLAGGLLQGAATAGAGLAAGAASGGTAAIPAAMAASAGSGAGIEAIRQGLGKMAGIEGNMSGSDIGIAGAAGLASPLLFGTGASGAKALKIAGTEGAEALLKSQRGLAGRAYDKTAEFVGPKLGSVVSGINEKVIKKARTMLPEIKAADTDTEIRSLPLKSVAEIVPKQIKEKTRETGQRLEALRNLIDNPPGAVMIPGEGAAAQGSLPTREFMKPFVELTEKLRKGAGATEAQKKDVETLEKIVRSEFEGLPENLTAAQVANLRDRFKERAAQYGLNYGKMGQVESASSGASAMDSQIAGAFEASRRNMSDELVKRLEAIAPDSAAEYATLNDQYAYLKNVAKENNSKFKTSKSVADFLGRSTRDDLEAQNLVDIQNITGTDLESLAARDQALRTFSKPSADIRSLGGTTSTTRSIPLATVGGIAGYYAGQQSGGEYSPYLTSILGIGLGSRIGSPAALRRYMEINKFAREVPTNVPGYSGLPYSLMNTQLNDQGE